MKRIILLSFAILLILSLSVRLILPRELDDLSPAIPCDDSLIKKSDILFVIPNFQGKSPISKNKKWCRKILSFNKTLALHGKTHEYREFGEPRSPEYVHEAFRIFQDCFNKSPAYFKPPHLAWTKENDWIGKIIPVKLKANQFFHKVYHCNDTGFFPNWLIDLV
ncbi:hypothetical protein D6829_02315 [Candidatus Pacearchaeota archaeon]|nr:MAG: hypothetical protein D6829_02315 [Candidatus Pacearchaeota archaeon]